MAVKSRLFSCLASWGILLDHVPDMPPMWFRMASRRRGFLPRLSSWSRGWERKCPHERTLWRGRLREFIEFFPNEESLQSAWADRSRLSYLPLDWAGVILIRPNSSRCFRTWNLKWDRGEKVFRKPPWNCSLPRNPQVNRFPFFPRFHDRPN